MKTNCEYSQIYGSSWRIKGRPFINVKCSRNQNIKRCFLLVCIINCLAFLPWNAFNNETLFMKFTHHFQLLNDVNRKIFGSLPASAMQTLCANSVAFMFDRAHKFKYFRHLFLIKNATHKPNNVSLEILFVRTYFSNHLIYSFIHFFSTNFTGFTKAHLFYTFTDI